VRYLDKVEPDQAIRVVSRIGDVAPTVRTGLGRALLGAQPNREDKLEHYFADPIIASQPLAVIDELRTKVKENFERLDHHGWVQEIGENQPGICCVAVPLFYEGKPEYAISVTTPYDRMPEARRQQLAEGIIREVATLPSDSPFAVRPIN
jgi:DNA-binding IclR family transcriptional regulator